MTNKLTKGSYELQRQTQVGKEKLPIGEKGKKSRDKLFPLFLLWKAFHPDFEIKVEENKMQFIFPFSSSFLFFFFSWPKTYVAVINSSIHEWLFS